VLYNFQPVKSFSQIGVFFLAELNYFFTENRLNAIFGVQYKISLQAQVQLKLGLVKKNKKNTTYQDQF